MYDAVLWMHGYFETKEVMTWYEWHWYILIAEIVHFVIYKFYFIAVFYQT